MSSSLTSEEAAAETADTREERLVHVEFRISASAIDALVEPGITERVFLGNVPTLLACGLYTAAEQLRDAQNAFKEPRTLAGGAPNVPAIERHTQLRNAGRYAALALTSLEQAIDWLRKAKARVG